MTASKPMPAAGVYHDDRAAAAPGEFAVDAPGRSGTLHAFTHAFTAAALVGGALSLRRRAR